MKSNKHLQKLQELAEVEMEEEPEPLPVTREELPGNTVGEMICGIVLYGVAVQLLVLIPPYRGFHSIGLWVGIIAACGLVIHMKRNIETAVDLGEAGARRHTVTGYLIRFLVVTVLFYLLYRFQIGSVVTAFIGIVGLKVGAYLQPYLHKKVTKRRG